MIYVERAPDAWVFVGTKADYQDADESSKTELLAGALKANTDSRAPWPAIKP
jgi:hypothetical protein